MNFMLNKVVEEGTGKRALLEGIQGRRQDRHHQRYRDAWFVGYTGNLVAAVWFGNDDHTSTNNMTGGTLPAMAWHEVMAFAHQNLEIRPIPGLARGRSRVAPGPPGADPDRGAAVLSGGRPGAVAPLFEVIGGIGDLFRRGRASLAPAPGAGSPGTEPGARPASGPAARAGVGGRCLARADGGVR